MGLQVAMIKSFPAMQTCHMLTLVSSSRGVARTSDIHSIGKMSYW
jgi:hypothetical protein